MKLQPRMFPLLALLLGMIGAVLRLLQLTFGFDPTTGLAVGGSLINILFPVFLIGVIALFILLSLPQKGKELTFEQCFRTPEGAVLMLLITAAFLFIAGSGLYLMEFLQQSGSILALAVGVLGFLGGGSLLFAVRCWRQDETLHGLLLLPPVALCLFHLLKVYLAHGTFPITARYGAEILAFSALLYGVYQIAAAGYRLGRRSALLRGIGLGIALSLTAISDFHSIAQCVTLAASAALLLAFGLSLRAEE